VLEITVLAPEDSGIAAVAGIKSELMAALKKAGSGSTIILDISNARKADSSLAQLVIALEREAAAKDCNVVIRNNDAQRSLRTMFCCDSMEGQNEEGRGER
jgi:hypothetical protein